MSSPAASSWSITGPANNKHTGKPFSGTYFRLRGQAESLPVHQHLPAIISAIKNNQVVILVGQTGSGQTTQVAKELVDQDLGIRVVLTQNGRRAADSVAGRIASELDVRPGTLVGLKYRGQSLTSASTRLDVVTDGTLLAMAKYDPSFQRYDIIIIDEVHAHTIATDFVMGLAKTALKDNPKSKLKVVIMSATINQEMFLSYFPGARLQEVPGRAFAVRTQYLEDEPQSGAMTDAIVQAPLDWTCWQHLGLCFWGERGQVDDLPCREKAEESADDDDVDIEFDSMYE